jgi:hypothetical protein
MDPSLGTFEDLRRSSKKGHAQYGVPAASERHPAGDGFVNLKVA